MIDLNGITEHETYKKSLLNTEEGNTLKNKLDAIVTNLWNDDFLSLDDLYYIAIELLYKLGLKLD